MVKLFMHSLRVRLKMFRIKYYIIASISIFILILNIGAFIFNKSFYIFLDKPANHFAYKYHIAKDLAKILKKQGIAKIYLKDDKLQKRLKFYGIKKGKNYILKTANNGKQNCNKIVIKYFNIPVKEYCLEKL